MYFRLTKRHIPILSVFDAALFHDQVVAGEELLDAFEHAQRRGHVAKPEVFLQRSKIQASRNIPNPQERFHLRSKEETLWLAPKIQRFFADAITPQDQPFAL